MMKKKILSLLAASALVVTSVQPVIADEITLSDLLNTAVVGGAFTTTLSEDGYAYNVNTKMIDVTVPSVVQARKASSGSWASYPESGSPLKTTASSLTSTDAKFDFKATVDMSNVRAAFTDFYSRAKNVAELAGLEDEFDSLKLNGEFVIDIETSGLSVPDAFGKSTSLAYFSDATKRSGIYTETKDRTKTSSNIIITVDVVNVDAAYIAEDVANRLCDLELECDNVEVNNYNTTSYAKGTFGVQTSFDAALTDDAYKNGYTTVSYTNAGGEESELITFDYASNSDVAYVKVTKKSSGSGSSGGTGGGTSLPVTSNTNTLQYVTPYGTVTSQTSNSSFVVKGSELPTPAASEQSSGMIFDGWYYDPSLTQPVQAEDDVDVSGTKTLYAKWLNTNVPSALHNAIDDEKHYAYVIGYPDGSVQPEGNITRAEVATIFYRLLNDEKRESIKTTTSPFSDVDGVNDWFGKYIATMSNGGYVHGYEDGTFRPDDSITRAEFATMAVAFAEQETTPTATFTDIVGHWAADYILKGAALGWINGYEDNTFRPDQYITRSEAMKLYNSVLNRHILADGFLSDSAILWPDNSTSEWYYYEVEEATNSHNYQRNTEGYYETWTEVIPNKTWD